MALLPTSEFFTLHQLAEGVYAAVGKVNSPAFSNAGIIDTGDHTLIFDTFNIVAAAEDLRRAAETLTNRQTDFVVISHYHSDHWSGNQVFSRHANILSTYQTSQAMADFVEEIKEAKHDLDDYEEYVKDVEKRAAETEDPRLRAHLSWSAIIERYQLETLSDLRPSLPNQTFDGRVAFHGPKRAVELYSPGAGHTASDLILQIPAEKIAFIGDLGFFQTHPYLGDSVPEKWAASLTELAASETETFVPGHGPVGAKADVLAMKEYILACKTLAANVLESGGSEEDAASQPMPDFSKDWAGFSRFGHCMRFLYQLEKKDE